MRLRWIAALLLPASGFGQTTMCAKYADEVEAIQALLPGKRDAPISVILKPAQHAECLATELAKGVERNLIKEIEAVRSDKQAGATPQAGSGSTSLVSKGVAAKALSIAEDYGALTQSVSGQTVTVQGSLDGIPGALIRGGLAPYCLDGIPRDWQKGCIPPKALNLLRRIGYGVSFDTSRSTQAIAGMAPSPPASGSAATPVTFSPTGHQISAISARFDIWNKRDTTSSAYVDSWLKAIKDASAGQPSTDAAKKMLTAFQATFDLSLNRSPEYQNWYKKSVETLQASASVKDDWGPLYRELLDILRGSKNVIQAAADLVTALDQYQLAQDDLISSVANKPVVTFEYSNNRPVDENTDSTYRIIADKGFGKHWSLTLNAAVDAWDQAQAAPANASRIRDVQAGMELDYKMNKIGGLINSAATASASYYFQDQRSAILVNVDPTQPLPGITFTGLPSGATQVLAQTGNIHIAQLKLVLGPGTSSVRVPIAFSYSNRSELVPKPNWRAQIGISYDFDSLFSK